MRLAEEKIEPLQKALISAFPDKASLSFLVTTRLGENLEAIAGGANLSEIVFSLIQWANSKGRLAELVEKAHDENPGNPDLLAFVEAFPDLSAVLDRPKNRGPLAYITCNRSGPTRQFRKEIERYLRDPDPCNIHFYVVQGTEEDCPVSFINRLWKYELKQLVEELAPSRWKGDPLIKAVDADWECRNNQSPDEALEILQDSILREVARDEALLTPGVNIGSDFHSRLRRLAHKYDVLVIRHRIAAQEWHPGMEAVLRQYLHFFAAMPGNTPFVLLFFTLEQEAPKGLLSFLNRGRAEKALSAIQRLHNEMASVQPTVLCCILNPLDDVDEQHVAQLLANIDRRIVETQINDQLKPLFGKRKRIKMAEIERYFKIDDMPVGSTGAGNAR